MTKKIDEKTATEARKKLASSPRKAKSKFERFLDENAGGRQFVELWLDMAAKGETDWSLRRVLLELRDSYGLDMNVSASDRFADLLRARYGDRYTRAEARVKGR